MVFRYSSLRAIKLLLIALGTGLVLLAPAGAVLGQSRILFVGNSFTHGFVVPTLNYNAAAIIDENFGLSPGSPRYESDGSGPWGGVPGIFKKFTDQAGLNYEVHIEVINGVGLTYHYTNALSVIQRAGWNQVVLQELSTGPLPTSKGGAPVDFFDYSTRIEQAVHAVNATAKVYLFETWARADLTYLANQPYSGQPITAMGTDLHNAYYQAYAQNGRFEAVAPVGDAWQLAMQTGVAMTNPYSPTAGQLDLWASFFHASKWGSYLGACVLFYQITGVDPRTLGAGELAATDLGIASADAVALQQVAYNQVNIGGGTSAYSLLATVIGNGTVNKNPDQPRYLSGSTVSLTATPAVGFQFSGWSGAATGTVNPLSVAMTSDKAITANFTPVTTQQVTGFTLVNADTNTDIQPLPSGASLNLATLPTRNLNIRANTSPVTVGSVVFSLSGAITRVQTDNVAPYALFLDNGGSYNPWTPPVGSYTLLATPYTSGGGSGATFYRAININGGAITLDGQSWVASSGAANFQLTGQAFSNQNITLSPATDATRAGMIRSSVYGRTVTAALSNAPAGTYSVYLYVWEDNFAQTFSITLEGQTVLANYNSGAAGHWDRLGPFTVPVTDGTINIATSGGDANLSGIEVWRQNTTSGVAGSGLSINFTVVDPPAPAQYTLTVNASSGGEVSKNPDQPSYLSGSTVSLTATPAVGFQFSGWSGAATGTTNPLSVSMTVNKTITATFTASGGSGLTFYRALNINGNALVLDGQNWEASTGAVNFTVTGTRFANQNVPLNPVTDAPRASMIRSSVYGPSIDATLRTVPAGTYAVYAYVWEDNNPEIFDVRVQGQVVLRSYNSGAAGRWSRLGPFTTSVTSNGTLVVSTVGGYANLSGIEVWRQNPAAAARTVVASGFGSAAHLALPATADSAGSTSPAKARWSATEFSTVPQASPNPSNDGRFWVLLPATFQGEVSYSLMSAVGARLTQGQLLGTAQPLPLDFSHEMMAAGLYYLLLEGQTQHARIKLVRP